LAEAAECDTVLLDLDLVKAFDRIPRALTFDVMEKLQAPAGVINALKGWQKEVRFRYRYNLGHGRPWRATNGFPQGCCLSCVLMNLWVMLWVRAVQKLPNTQGVSRSLAAYADDQKVHFIAHVSHRAALRRDICRVLEISEGWARVTDQAYNPAKSQLWTLRPEAIDALGEFSLDGSRIPWVRSINLLGLDLVSGAHQEKNTKQQQRTREVVKAVWRLKHLPLPLRARSSVCGMKFMSKSAHGCGVFRPPVKDVQWHDKAMIEQLWHGAPNRAAEALAILHGASMSSQVGNPTPGPKAPHPPAEAIS
jgi:hypothetical protein